MVVDRGAVGELFAPGADDVASIEGGGVLGEAVGSEEPGGDRAAASAGCVVGVWAARRSSDRGVEADARWPCVPAGAELDAFDVAVLGWRVSRAAYWAALAEVTPGSAISSLISLRRVANASITGWGMPTISALP